MKEKKMVSILLSCVLLIGISQGIFMHGGSQNYANASVMEAVLNQQSYNGSEQNDVLEGISEEQQNTQVCIDEPIVSTRSLAGSESCIEHCTSHGSGRENGGTNLLNSGCRNYMGWSYENYGTVDIPYWINQSSMNTMSATHRQLLLNDIREQAELWNDVKMYDGSGQLINLYEVGIGESNRPSNIDGKQVVEVLRLDGNYAGQFSPSALQIRINYNSSGSGTRPGRNVDTPMHEMGHLLGLYDLDPGNQVAYGTHRVLMGYNRGTTEATLDQAIKYQDIQGVAVANNCHTNHQYTRYVKNGNKYLHICFYCDMIEERTEPLSGSSAMGTVTNCNHNYGAMVSAGDRLWLKCSKCYKILETTIYDYTNLFAGGNGDLNNPFLISNAEQFRNIGCAYTSVYVPREGMENQITYAFKLTNNITIPGDWTPFSYKFAGNFDGNGYYISYAMQLTQSEVNDSDKQGLFGFVISPAQIYDLELINCTITSDVNTVMSTSHTFVGIGILAGSVYSASGISDITVTNPKIECKISGASIGALAGSLQATSVTNCVVREVNGTAAITNNTHGYLGGMAGMGDIGRFSGGSITISLTNEEFNADNDMMGKVVGNAGDTVPSGMTANVTMDQGDTCIAAGTLITLADGTQKAVEDLTGNEMLLVWNLQTGQFDSAPILFIDSDPAAEYSVINLYFSDGTQTKVISEHGFWDHDLNKYVYLDKDAAQYIGHWFNILSTDEDGNRVTEKVQLVNVVIQNEYTVAYSPVTYGHLCYYVNGMLSMPGGIEGLFNIFEADAETMKYDEAQMQADIAQYGLFTYEEFAEIFPISEEVFEAFNGQYLKVAMGKGLIDAEGLQILIERYAEFLSAVE